MRVKRVEFLTDYKLGSAEAFYSFWDRPSSTEDTNLPVPEKPGCEIHLLGDWIYVREVWKDKQKPRASLLVPRERVKYLLPGPEQAKEIFDALKE